MSQPEIRNGEPAIYRCEDCGLLRTKSEGGTIFTVCDDCWAKRYGVAPAQAAPAQTRSKFWTQRDEDGHCTRCGLLWTATEEEGSSPHECPPGFWQGVEAEAPRGDQRTVFEFDKPGPCSACGDGDTAQKFHKHVYLEARGDQPIDIEREAREWWSVATREEVGLPEDFHVLQIAVAMPKILAAFYRHMQSKTQPNREGK